MSNEFFNQPYGIPKVVDNGFQSLADVLQRASRENRRNDDGSDKKSSKYEIKITPETFESDYKTKTIATSELCELLTNRLGSVFSDYVGCRDIVYTNSPQIGVALVFDDSTKNSKNDHDTRLKAIEDFKFDNVGKDQSTRELEMVARFNGASSIRESVHNGTVTETAMGFRLSNEAIDVLKETVIDFGKDNSNHDNFRKQCITYALSSDGTHNNLIVYGATMESILGFIYGNQYDYVIIPGAPVNTNSYSGRLLEVKQLHPDTTKRLLKKYVSRQIVSDGLYRPER